MAKIPEDVLNGMSSPTASGGVLHLGADGTTLRTLQDPRGDTFGITTAVQRDDCSISALHPVEAPASTGSVSSRRSEVAARSADVAESDTEGVGPV